MNVPLLIAALLAFVIAALHSILGERYVVRRLLRLELPPLGRSTTFMRHTIWFAWHLTTVLGWGIALLLLNMSMGVHALWPDRTILGWMFIACALLSFLGTRARHFSWPVFATIAVLILVSGPRG